ncbi:hypothetical protein [Pseudothauera rhizosphaerae]|uniref:Uncharacterized protein n=1 Tax=Pseudothauera rhizosphaerae TaxID=2565932 RepID=A0A4S4ATX9_9RHOO|nr:hypothetical protein [Pseudothauera rhizosphaerae]THF63387.1 hypothetical protein E6O51_04825 [Pseudothauera rhizosphaerae]
MNAIPYALAAGLLLAAAPALAHHPFGECAHLNPETVRCSGGFDEKPIPGLRIDVLDGDDNILIGGRLDAQASFTFERPAVPFYVLIDAGPGHVVEIDGEEVK